MCIMWVLLNRAPAILTTPATRAAVAAEQMPHQLHSPAPAIHSQWTGKRAVTQTKLQP